VKRPRAALACFCAACALLWACGTNQKKPPKYKLQGSLTEYMVFGYDEVRYESNAGASDFAFAFIRYRGEDLDGGTPAGEDVPLKVTVRTGNLTPEQLEALDFDLAADAGNGGIDQTGVLSRNVLNDPRRSFTTLQRGGLKVNRLPAAPGERVSGSFHVTFDPGIDFSSGRTLFGDFTAVMPEP
jgi:hypothetical protein